MFRCPYLHSGDECSRKEGREREQADCGLGRVLERRSTRSRNNQALPSSRSFTHNRRCAMHEGPTYARLCTKHLPILNRATRAYSATLTARALHYISTAATYVPNSLLTPPRRAHCSKPRVISVRS